MLFSIPSPGDPFLINSGPVHVRWYGLLLALGVLLAGWIARRVPPPQSRPGAGLHDRGLGGADGPGRRPPLPRRHRLGLVPPRLLADPGDLERRALDLRGGAGRHAGRLDRRRRVHMRFWVVADCVAPGIVLAQALGRFGNYFNQELYGKPSDLPWAVKIDNPQPPYAPGSTFHPTFLYESIWDLIVFGLLVLFIRRFWNRVPAGTVFALYVALYSLGRMPIERLRIDTADIIFGQRVNVWVTVILLLIGLISFIILFRRRTPRAQAPAPGAAGGRRARPRADAAPGGRDRGPPSRSAARATEPVQRKCQALLLRDAF